MVGIHYTPREVRSIFRVPEVACQTIDPDMVVSKREISNIKNIGISGMGHSEHKLGFPILRGPFWGSI